MRRIPIGYILITAIVTLAVTLAAVSFLNSGATTPQREQIVITVPILITTTPNPDTAPRVVVVTATPLPGTPDRIDLPPGLLDAAGASASTRAAAPTIDPTILSLGGAVLTTATALPPGCTLHTVAEGDTVFGIAERYGAGGFDMLTVNGLETTSLLSIGQVLIVPLPGCPLLTLAQQATEAVALTPSLTPSNTGTPPTLTFTPSLSPTPSNTPTATLPPTAASAQMEIARVVSAGVVTSEAVEIRNNGAVVDLNGWTLRVNGETVYTFPEQRLFTGGLVTVNTRTGTNTPVALFQNRDAPLLRSGDVVTLIDAANRVQSTLRVP